MQRKSRVTVKPSIGMFPAFQVIFLFMAAHVYNHCDVSQQCINITQTVWRALIIDPLSVSQGTIMLNERLGPVYMSSIQLAVLQKLHLQCWIIIWKTPFLALKDVFILSPTSNCHQNHMESERGCQADASGTTERFHRVWKEETIHVDCSPTAHLPLEWSVWRRQRVIQLSVWMFIALTKWHLFLDGCAAFTFVWVSSVGIWLAVLPT